MAARARIRSLRWVADQGPPVEVHAARAQVGRDRLCDQPPARVGGGRCARGLRRATANAGARRRHPLSRRVCVKADARARRHRARDGRARRDATGPGVLALQADRGAQTRRGQPAVPRRRGASARAQPSGAVEGRRVPPVPRRCTQARADAVSGQPGANRRSAANLGRWPPPQSRSRRTLCASTRLWCACCRYWRRAACARGG
mmetsp:Transcript_12216/g.30755  ORF Transcript_12216/g.30755 Transcript_12216/m.30755 type:complete len:203 (+) Transcript_12216:242-850(+)